MTFQRATLRLNHAVRRTVEQILIEMPAGRIRACGYELRAARLDEAVTRALWHLAARGIHPRPDLPADTAGRMLHDLTEAARQYANEMRAEAIWARGTR